MVVYMLCERASVNMRGCGYQYAYRHASSLFRRCCYNLQLVYIIRTDSTVIYCVRPLATGLSSRVSEHELFKNSQAWIFSTKVSICSIPKPRSSTIVIIVSGSLRHTVTNEVDTSFTNYSQVAKRQAIVCD